MRKNEEIRTIDKSSCFAINGSNRLHKHERLTNSELPFSVTYSILKYLRGAFSDCFYFSFVPISSKSSLRAIFPLVYMSSNSF